MVTSHMTICTVKASKVFITREFTVNLQIGAIHIKFKLVYESGKLTETANNSIILRR